MLKNDGVQHGIRSRTQMDNGRGIWPTIYLDFSIFGWSSFYMRHECTIIIFAKMTEL